jgi:hypothetical protein
VSAYSQLETGKVLILYPPPAHVLETSSNNRKSHHRSATHSACSTSPNSRSLSIQDICTTSLLLLLLRLELPHGTCFKTLTASTDANRSSERGDQITVKIIPCITEFLGVTVSPHLLNYFSFSVQQRIPTESLLIFFRLVKQSENKKNTFSAQK